MIALLLANVCFGTFGDVELEQDEAKLIFYNGTNYVTFRASGSLAGDYDFVWMVNDGDSGQYLKTDGSGVFSFGTPAGAGDMLAATYDADEDGLIDQAAGGTELDTSGVTNGQLLIGTTAANVWALATLTGTANEIDITNGASSIIIGIVDPLIVAKGGTGAATFTDGGILLGSGVGAITALGVASNGQIPIGDGATDPVLATLTEGLAIDVTNGAGSITLAFDPTELLGNRTWGDASTDTIVWTWDRATGTDPAMTFGNDFISLNGDLKILGDDLFMTTNTDRFVLMGDGTNYNPEVINLGTDTTGNYVLSVATTSPLSGGAAGSEGAVLTLTIADADDAGTKGAASFDATDFDDDGSGGITIVDDGHAHTGTSISGIDISDDTNLTVTAPITLTDDDVGITVAKDIVAGVGLSGGENDVLPGADADTTLTFDATELDALTWDAGSLASIAWSWNLSAGDPTITFGNDLVTFSNSLTVATGKNITLGTTQWNSSDEIDGTKIKDADYGDVLVSAGGAWTLDTDSVADNEIDYTAVTLADFTDDVGYLKADGTVDLTGNWAIATNNIVLTAGGLQAEHLLSTDDGVIADRLIVGSTSVPIGATLEIGTAAGPTYIDGANDILVTDDVEIEDELFVVNDVNVFGDVNIPSGELQVISTTVPQFILGYDTGNTVTATVSSGGNLTVAAPGGIISFSDEAIGTSGTADFGATTVTSLVSTGSLTADSPTLVVDDTNDRVGIGTASPSAVGSPMLHIVDTDDADSHIVTLQAGSTANQRTYVKWNDYLGNQDWLIGKNAQSRFILFSSGGAVNLHRLQCVEDGATNINSADTFSVLVNSEPNSGSGGLLIYGGGVTPALNFELTDSLKYKGTTEDVGAKYYDGASLIAEELYHGTLGAGNKYFGIRNYLADGMFWYNDIGDLRFYQRGPNTTDTINWYTEDAGGTSRLRMYMENKADATHLILGSTASYPLHLVLYDNVKTYYGTGKDGSIYHDGSNLHIDAQDVAASGNIILDNVPAADPGVAGALWSDSGTLKISAGP